MNKIYTRVAIILIATMSILLLKNYLIEYQIDRELATKNVVVNSVDCNGLYNIDCNLNNIELKYQFYNIEYLIRVKEVSLNNILEIYGSYINRDYLNSNFEINIKNILFKDTQNIFNEVSKEIDINIIAKNSKFKINMDREDLNITLQSQYHISLSTQNRVVHNIFYEFYKIAFFEMKQQDGTAIATGLNISLGKLTSDFISKEYFLAHSIDRAIDLAISEIESYEIFNKYNHNNQLSNILEFLLKQEGKKDFDLKIQN